MAEFYDHVVPYRDRNDLQFFVDMARESGGPVLEIGCGTGRVLIPTARAGIETVGLDGASRMLAECRRRLADEPSSVQASVTALVEGDMRRFDLQRRFSLITLPFRPFQHLITVEDQIACLTSIRRHLAESGRMILDLFNPSLPFLVDEKHLVEHGDEPPFTMPDGRMVVRRIRVRARDLYTQVVDSELIYHVTHPNGHEETLTHRFSMRYLFRFETEHLLARCGFAVEQIYSDYDRSAYGSKYPGELIVIATAA